MFIDEPIYPPASWLRDVVVDPRPPHGACWREARGSRAEELRALEALEGSPVCIREIKALLWRIRRGAGDPVRKVIGVLGIVSARWLWGGIAPPHPLDRHDILYMAAECWAAENRTPAEWSYWAAVDLGRDKLTWIADMLIRRQIPAPYWDKVEADHLAFWAVESEPGIYPGFWSVPW